MILKGLCHCGCGGETQIAKVNNTQRGHVAGEPRRYIKGHGARKHYPEPIVDTNGCWIWQGAVRQTGYGVLYRGKCTSAYQVYYEKYKGPIPEGLDLDHLCRNRLCVNPDHLEPVTRAVNLQRGATAKLNPAKVRMIRRAYSTGTTIAELARQYRVDGKTIHAVVTFRSWKNISEG